MRLNRERLVRKLKISCQWTTVYNVCNLYGHMLRFHGKTAAQQSFCGFKSKKEELFKRNKIKS